MSLKELFLKKLDDAKEQSCHTSNYDLTYWKIEAFQEAEELFLEALKECEEKDRCKILGDITSPSNIEQFIRSKVDKIIQESMQSYIKDAVISSMRSEFLNNKDDIIKEISSDFLVSEIKGLIKKYYVQVLQHRKKDSRAFQGKLNNIVMSVVSKLEAETND